MNQAPDGLTRPLPSAGVSSAIGPQRAGQPPAVVVNGRGRPWLGHLPWTGGASPVVAVARG